MCRKEKTPCCKHSVHHVCLGKWFQSQINKHLFPSCLYCRADPPTSILNQLVEVPPSSPPTSRWEAARRHSEFLSYAWDDSIPLERDSFFLEFLNLYVPSNVFVYQTFNGIHLATIRRYENRRISRFWAQTKREAIRRLCFELANLLDF